MASNPIPLADGRVTMVWVLFVDFQNQPPWISRIVPECNVHRFPSELVRVFHRKSPCFRHCWSLPIALVASSKRSIVIGWCSLPISFFLRSMIIHVSMEHSSACVIIVCRSSILFIIFQSSPLPDWAAFVWVE